MGMAGRPWSRVHVDYAEPFIGKMFLLIIDAHSKLMGIHRVSSATSSVTIDRMRSTFPSHGLPDIAVFNSVSSEKKNGINHIDLSTLPPKYKWPGGASGTDL